MARRSILTPALEPSPQRTEHPGASEPAPSKTAKNSRVDKLHIGGYFHPDDRIIMAFQKLKVDLRRSQQEMLLEALADYVAKHEAARAFR